MVKTRDFLKKTGDTKRISDAKICTTKARNGRDLTEAEEILKRSGICRRTIQKSLNNLD